ncbi:MAG: Na-translocating system protein MpsC family protein [Planctomycetota bacterium]
MAIIGYKIQSLNSDISTKTGERIIVFVLDKDLETKFIYSIFKF